MELLPEHLHRTLTYISAVNRAGAALSLSALEAYASSPLPLAGRRVSRFATAMSVYADAFERREAGETVGAFLQRAQWITVTPDVKLTALGRAALQHADRAPLADVADEPLVVTIDPDDRLAYARIFELMSTYGEGLLIDRYLTLEGLGDIMDISSVDRVLTSDDARRNRLTIFGRALGTGEGSPELRTLPGARLHDRYFIPDEGPVFVLGSSLNSISARPGVVTPIADAAADAIRSAYSVLWSEAMPLASIEPGDASAD